MIRKFDDFVAMRHGTSLVKKNFAMTYKNFNTLGNWNVMGKQIKTYKYAISIKI